MASDIWYSTTIAAPINCLTDKLAFFGDLAAGLAEADTFAAYLIRNVGCLSQ